MQWEIIGLLGPLAIIFIYMFNSLKGDIRSIESNLKGDIRDAKLDMEKLFEARLIPINDKLGNHITDTNKQIAELKKGQANLEQGQKAILEKLDTINKSG